VFATIFQRRFSSGCERAVLYRILLLCAVMFTGANPSSAGELTELNVNEQDGVYRIRMEMQVDAPATHVYEALTDFARISRLNPAITRSETLPSQIPGVTRVRTLIEDCILVHCVSISRVEEIREGLPGHLHVETDPRQSDFKSGFAHWWIKPQGTGSTVIYEASMEPDFFLPPLVGRVFMKRGLREGILETFENLERIASLDAGMAEPSLVAYGMTEH